MTGLRPSLGLAALLAALAVPAPALHGTPTFLGLSVVPAGASVVSLRAAAAQDLTRLFQEGMALLKEGKNEEALAKFQEILARDPSNEEAYELWKSSDERAWLELLTKEGQFELVARHLMGQVRAERVERRNDGDAIRDLVSSLGGANALERARLVQQLASQHGEYAVPYMLPALADRSDDDRRVVTVQALTRFGPDVVPPLVEAMSSPDAFLRRNVAATLGYIGDRRALGVLLHALQNDGDEAVRAAADKALAQMGAARNTSAAEALVAEGHDYLARRDNVLSPVLWSDVVWHMDGGRLNARDVPRLVFAEEMAKQSFYRALAADAGHGPALAGIARASLAAEARVADAAAAGADVGDMADQMASGSLAALAAGHGALDAALASCLADGDAAGARAVIQLLGRSGVNLTPALRNAVQSEDAAVSEEAALAVAHISLARGEPVGDGVVERLARAAGRVVLQGALVIDADAQRSETLVAALRGRGMLVHQAASGAAGVAAQLRAPTLDLVVIAEQLPDLTAAQVLQEIERNPAQASAARLILAADAEAAAEIWGERVAGVIGAGLELDVLDEALAEGLGRDREMADDLAARSANALVALARSGVNVSAARENLLRALGNRSDAIVLPALAVLGSVATPDDVDALVEVLLGDRSEELRVAAADALAGLFARHRAAPDADTLASLSELLRSGESLSLRRAVANALGQLDLNAGLRAALVRDVRFSLGAQ